MEQEMENLYWNSRVSRMQGDKEFETYYARWMKTLEEGMKLSCGKKQVKLAELDNELLQTILGQLQKISLRVLLAEMQLANQFGELIGEDDVEKYTYYAQVMLQDEVYLRELYAVYPEMYHSLLREIETVIQNLIKILENFNQDLNEINHFFFAKNRCRKIIRIGGGSSDGHNGGKRVYWLLLDNGEYLVYKPRSLAIDRAFHSFVNFVSDAVGITYQWNYVLDKGEYGWCEWVEKSPCRSREQLKNYYFRNGLLLCVSYLLGAEDMHYENLIAHGEYPVIVDLEMGMGSRGIRAEESEWSEIERIYQESVLHTGLLPLYAWNENGEGVNVGALNGSGEQLCPIRMPVVVQAGTVNMHIEYRQLKMGEGKNLAMLNDEFIEPYEFLEDIQRGFGSAYRVIMNHKELVLEKLKEFQKVPIRYLIRETQQYVMILNNSYYPKYLMSHEEREAQLRLLNHVESEYTEKSSWTSEQEEKELGRGDVPYFWYDAWNRDLHSGTGEVYPDYFPTPVIQCIERRLRKMEERDLMCQQKLIHNALLIGSKESKKTDAAVMNQKFPKVKVHRDKTVAYTDAGLQVAEWIGDILLEEAIWSEDRKSVGWISIVMAGYQERGYLMRPMSNYLYDGLSGVAVFMAALAKEGANNRFDYTAEILIRQLFAYTDKIHNCQEAPNLPTGAFTGEASLVYAYLLLYEMTGEAIFLKYIKLHCEIVGRNIELDRTFDVLGGNAGVILVMLRVYESTGDEQYLAWAVKAGETLIKAATVYEWGIGWVNFYAEKALTGFAHGASGMILALSKLGYYIGEKAYHDAAYKAFLFEQHYFLPEVGDWEDRRFEDDVKKEYDLAWCHGRGGILASYHIVEKYADDKLRTAIHRVISEVKMAEWQNKNKNAFCLCHGRIGNMGLFYAVGENAKAEIEYEKTVRLLLMKGKEGIRSLLQLQECDNFGLLGGVTGIGYGCICRGEDLLMIEKIKVYLKDTKKYLTDMVIAMNKFSVILENII